MPRIEYTFSNHARPFHFTFQCTYFLRPSLFHLTTSVLQLLPRRIKTIGLKNRDSDRLKINALARCSGNKKKKRIFAKHVTPTQYLTLISCWFYDLFDLPSCCTGCNRAEFNEWFRASSIKRGLIDRVVRCLSIFCLERCLLSFISTIMICNIGKIPFSSFVQFF